ncbi:MAG: HEPN domain-containing protein [Porticoccaceae bacterium]
MDLPQFRIERIFTRDQALLFQDWFLLLAKGLIEINGSGSSGTSWTLNTNVQNAIKITFIPEAKALEIEAQRDISDVVKQISSEAHKHVESNTPTPGGWWSIGFDKQQGNMDQNSLLHMMRNLGTYKRGPEKLRLGRSALLEIKDDTGEHPALFPKLSIEVSIISPGAPSGPFSKSQVEKMVPIVGAVLSSCFGTPLTPSPALFPVKDEKLNEVVDGIKSNDILELGFQGVPIWSVLQNCHLSGAGELADRLVGAMMAYEAGMLQRTDHSTLLFFVSAIEALTVPNLKSAKTQRLSKRFCSFLDDFATTAMDEVMAHSNFEQAFGRITNRKKFAAELYNLRSQPVHTGRFGNYSGMMMADDQSMKVGLVNDVVTGAIAALIKQPVSLLWGHPELDPSITIKLNPDEYQKIKKKAKNHHKKVDEYIKYLSLKNIH